MGKYRKKPIVIEAFKWTGDFNQTEDPEWIIDAIRKGIVIIPTPAFGKTIMEIKTLEGVMIANQGDYIIRGVTGEIYPCKPDIFEMTYEKVEDGYSKVNKCIECGISAIPKGRYVCPSCDINYKSFVRTEDGDSLIHQCAKCETKECLRYDKEPCPY